MRAAIHVTSKKLEGGGKRVCIIIDEVEGMGRGDRVGMLELIKRIDETLVAIICICNDHASSTVRSLRNKCLLIPFRKPSRPPSLRAST
jgi:replication factor C subunit 1